jgi:hypothetical protein
MELKKNKKNMPTKKKRARCYNCGRRSLLDDLILIEGKKFFCKHEIFCKKNWIEIVKKNNLPIIVSIGYGGLSTTEKI